MSERLASELNALGHDAVTTTSFGRKAQLDPDQLLLPAEMNRILVAVNGGDFRMRQRAWIIWSRAWSIPTPPHAGILHIRREQPALLPEEVIIVIDAISQRGAPFTNHLFAWNRFDGWREEE